MTKVRVPLPSECTEDCASWLAGRLFPASGLHAFMMSASMSGRPMWQETDLGPARDRMLPTSPE